MDEEDVFRFLLRSLEVQVKDSPVPSSCGGEVEGNAGVEVTLLLKHPTSGELVVVHSCRCDLS
jgi:hypothetical protein